MEQTESVQLGQTDSVQLREHVHQASAEARALVDSVSAVLNDLEAVARDQLSNRFYATVAAAFGVGYVLGGGLPLRTTGMLANMGMQWAVRYAARQVQEAAFGGNGGSQGAGI